MSGGCLRHYTARPRRLRYPVNGLLSGLNYDDLQCGERLCFIPEEDDRVGTE